MRTGCIVRDGRASKAHRPAPVARQSGSRRGVLPVTVTFALVLMWIAVTDAAATSYRVQLSHGLVHAELSPPSRCTAPPCPLVVLVPGFAVPMVVWDATVPALEAAGFSVLRFDLYGRGRSARPRVNYRPELFAEQIWELVNKLRPERRFHVVASSMGGAVAAVFAARHPDALDRLVLVGPVGLANDFPVLVTFLRAPGLGKWYFTSRFHALMLDHLRDNINVDVCAYPAVQAEFRRQLEIPGTADAMFSTFRNTLLADVEDDYRQLGRRHRPTLAIWGAEDRLVPFDSAVDHLSQLIPHLEVERIRGAGHLPQLERPHAFNAMVTRFLQR